jgi:DNA excision repair protein ERCC-6
VQLSDAQREMYKSFLKTNDVKEALNQTKSPLAAITVLRKICDSTQLVSLPDSTPAAAVVGETSNKLRALIALLKDLCIEKEHKTVVFCHSKKMMDLMEQEVEKHLARRGFTHLRVDGDTKKEDRQRLIRTFNKNEPLLTVGGEEGEQTWDCLFLSTGVGALGIEITGADRVIIFQPHWNPAQDDQAVDRLFRIGQRNNVVCFRLITTGTVEEKMSEIQLRKSSLARNVLHAGSAERSYAFSSQLNNLFVLEEDEGREEEFGEDVERDLAEVERILSKPEDARDRNELLSQVSCFSYLLIFYFFLL